MLSDTTLGYIVALVTVAVVVYIGRCIYVEIVYRKEEAAERKRHQDNVKAWTQLFGCNEQGDSDLESTRAISIVPRRTAEEIGNDYAYALSLQFLHTDERRILR